jgi:dipeptidase D
VPPDRVSEVEALVAHLETRLKSEWLEAEPGLQVAVSPLPAPAATWPDGVGTAVTSLLRELPHGVLRLSDVFPGKVETSANLATVRTEDAHVVVATSTRSFVVAELERLQCELTEIGARVGAELEPRPAYPAWEPNRASELLRVAERVYAEVFGHPAQVQVIHAGLECGIIAAKLPGMEAISFGPLIRGAHTPEEYVEIPSVDPIWRLLTALLSALA